MYANGIIIGHIIDYSTIVLSNATDAGKENAAAILTENAKYFAINTTSLGVSKLILTYLGNTLFCYSAARQVTI